MYDIWIMDEGLITIFYSYREADLRAEQQEKKNQTLQQEIEAMEAKHEDLTAKYKDARAEMDELVRQLEVA